VPTFYLIDGHAQIFRAYFAPFRDLSAPDGSPVKATFVFAQMLINLIRARSPDYLAMVIDSAGDQGLHRSVLYPEYKANRSTRPDDFEPQEQRIIQLVKDAGVPIYHLPGWEADDVLATLARRMEARGFDVVLVSKDKDLRQLLSDHVRMYDPGSDTFTTPESLMADMGFTPAQAVEVQTLMGDKIDNVPGIPGVGDKTAVELIKQFGSAQAVIDRADEIKKPKLKENVKAFGEKIALTRQLVTLATDLEVPEFDVDKCRFTGLNTEAVRRHFAELGFTSLIKRLEGNEPSADAAPKTPARSDDGGGAAGGLFGDVSLASPTPAQDGPILRTSEGLDYRLVNTPELLAEFVAELSKQTRFAFDTETDDLGAMRSNAIGFSFSWKEGTGWYLPVQGPLGPPLLDLHAAVAAIKPALENPAVEKYGHNIKYDILVMRNLGVRVRGLALDTMVGAFLLDAGKMQYGIDRLAEQMLGFRKIPTSDLIGTGKSQVSMARVPIDRVARYASEDADICLRLANLLERDLAEVPTLEKLNREVEAPLIDVLAEMEFNGVAVDTDILKEQSKVLGERALALRERILQEAGCDFNPDSPKQLAEVLFTRLGLKSVKKTKTGHSTDVEVLEKLAGEHPVPKLILEYRSLVKLKNTYLDNLTEHISPKTGRIHTHFSPVGAATGRLSSSDPNLQNIPIRTDEGRRIRLAFVPGVPGELLLSADYSQVELRVLAHFTREPALMEAFARDEDVHAAVASQVFGVPLADVTRDQRGQAKTINFGIIYGVTAFGLSRRIEGLSTSAADKLIREYNAKFPSIERFLSECVDKARRDGYVETILGRRRPLPEIDSGTITMRNAAERMAINSVVQGSAADLIKLAMLRIHRRILAENRPTKMLLQVHDELVFQTPENHAQADAKMVEEEMVGAMSLEVPLRVEVGIGKNWGEL
jgi:DNA polymerase-1